MYYYTFLLKDPLIWEEMQKYFPVSDFSSEDVARDFYELYFISSDKASYINDSVIY